MDAVRYEEFLGGLSQIIFEHHSFDSLPNCSLKCC
jgi:hypothetical protein